MSGKKKGKIANPDLHSSESPAKDGNELKNRINETAKYSELFEKIDVDSDYDDILATYGYFPRFIRKNTEKERKGS